jgi:hypothetical protein
MRRAFLCGRDSFNGRNFDHRKQWILELIKRLSSIFTADVCVIMFNHFHLVFWLDSQVATGLPDNEEIECWLHGQKAVQRFCH